MKVCYIITSTINSGPVNVLYNLLFNHREVIDFSPIILTLKADDVSKSRRADFEELGVKVIDFYNSKTWFSDILNFINKSDFEVIHSHGLIPDLINNYVRKKENHNRLHVTTQHNYPFEDYPQRKGKILGIAMALMQVYAIKNLHKVACSYSIAEKYKKRHISMDVVQNGIIFPKEYIGLSNKNNERPIFLYLGRIHDRKNVPFLVDYFQYHPEYELWIVGDGAKYEDVKKMAQSIDNIKIFGKTETPKDYYLKTDYYISASKSEGLPLSVLEAMSYGLPCVLSNIDSHREIMNLGNFGGIFDNNMESMDNTIHTVLDSKYNELEIYQNAKLKFDAEVMMNNYIEIYRNNKVGEKY